ncbi:histidine phosphatase superfamily [Aspergillus pseudoustus]|uniref:Histidine phosphatase superfamily n=1 Tax=Aspergillus pseudoustus TaxID=1810923 RepID=A0ABR4J283_9EURO
MKLTVSAATLGFVALTAATSNQYINYTTVQGYFEQDLESTDPSTYDYTSHNFGLIDRSYDSDKPASKNLTQWERFHAELQALNDNSPKHVSYKLFFLGRHGEGYHNAAESYFGTPAWNCYYSLLTGNGTTTWFDADLTTEGINQAEIAHRYWLAQYKTQHIHFPDAYYSSPMTRALKTANITFSNLPLAGAGAATFLPEVKEGFREGMSMHTCDERRSKSYIESLFPTWTFEKGFTEEDELWTGVTVEPSGAQDERSRAALDDIFGEKKVTKRPDGVCVPHKKNDLVISVTAHSGEISSILRVIGHQTFKLSTGAVIPVLIRAEEIAEEEPTTTIAWTQSAYCAAPPATSTASGCVCQGSATPITSGYPVGGTTVATPTPF